MGVFSKDSKTGYVVEELLYLLPVFAVGLLVGSFVTVALCTGALDATVAASLRR